MAFFKWLLGKDRNGNVDYSIHFTDESYQWVMAASDTDTLTVPANMTKALFQIQSGAVVHVSLSSISASTGTPTKTGAQISPALRNVTPGETIYFRAVDAAEICVSFYEE